MQIVDGQVQLTPEGKPNTSITETTTRPSIVPFGLGHYRLWEGASYDRRWAVLATGGMGISPYSGSTDFAAGLTVVSGLGAGEISGAGLVGTATSAGGATIFVAGAGAFVSAACTVKEMISAKIHPFIFFITFEVEI